MMKKVMRDIIFKLMINILKIYMNFIMIVKKLVANLHDKTEYIRNTRSLKQALNHGLNFKIVYRMIKFNRKA